LEEHEDDEQDSTSSDVDRIEDPSTPSDDVDEDE
jgi:hypothetical protein